MFSMLKIKYTNLSVELQLLTVDTTEKIEKLVSNVKTDSP
jgi:hypothetical protein